MLEQAILQAKQIMDCAVQQYKPVATITLFSGGNDSTVTLHFSRPWITHAAHINTGIGIPSTTEYVRQVCKDWNVPLIELVTPPEVYRNVLFAKRADGQVEGFPGPMGHRVCYWHLKQQRLRELRRVFVHNSRKDRVLYVTGIRASESLRRMARGISVPIRKDGSTVWVNPILHFDSYLVGKYRQIFNLPQCEAAGLLHRSGECLCGAFAKPEELKEIELWFPKTGAYIRNMERELREVGARHCEWGGGGARKTLPVPPGPLCVGCGGQG